MRSDFDPLYANFLILHNFIKHSFDFLDRFSLLKKEDMSTLYKTLTKTQQKKTVCFESFLTTHRLNSTIILIMDDDMNRIKEALLKHKINNDTITNFFKHCEEESFDYLAIKLDISDSDPTQSSLYDFIKDELKDTKIFEIIKSVCDPSYSLSLTQQITKDTNTTTNKQQSHSQNTTKPTQDDQQNQDQIQQQQKHLNSDEEHKNDINTNYNTSVPTPIGIGIVDGSLVSIPETIKDSWYESVDGITEILKYNKKLIDKQFSNYGNIFWDFWDEFVDDYGQTYEQIYNDLQYGTGGQTVVCMNEHPPSERAKPILERIVFELKRPYLASNDTEISSSTKNMKKYKPGIIQFYQKHLPIYYDDFVDDTIINSSLLCKLNQNDSKLIDMQFELFTILIDIWDRLNIINNDNGNYDDIKKVISSSDKYGKSHYAKNLNKVDADNLCQAVMKIKSDNDGNGIFKSLNYIKDKEKINDFKQYQLITMGFIKFIKGFIYQTDDDLHRYNHVPYRNKKKKKKGNEKEKNILDFNNNNFPLQFDLVILSQTDANIKDKKYFLDDFVQDEGIDKQLFHVGIEEIDITIKDENRFIEQVKNKILKAFRYILQSQMKDKMKQKATTKKRKKKKNKDREKKRDDRYIVVIDKRTNDNNKTLKLYLYPPYILNKSKNGEKVMIKHRKKINTINNESDDDDDDKEKEEEEAASKVEEQAKNGNKKEEKEEEKKEQSVKEEVDGELKENRFSLIGYECNELTNFYLTSKCLIPSSIMRDDNDMRLYGVDEFEFVFSAHFHAQKSWYPHPKLKMYQYFNGGGLRFFENDIVHLWMKYFMEHKQDKDKCLSMEDIKGFKLFDDILNLKKCDEIYRKWYYGIYRSITSTDEKLLGVIDE